MNDDRPKDRFQAEFEALPLDQKFSSLFRMEAATLTETAEYVFNSSVRAIEKMADMVSEFGTRVEREVNRTADKAESNTEAKPGQGGPKRGAKSKATPPPPPPPPVG